MNVNKFQSKVTIWTQNQYLDYFTDPSFQPLNRPFVLSFENNLFRRMYTMYFLPTVKIKYYSVVIDERNFFRLQYFTKYYQKTAIGLSKQQALGANPKAKQQINFTGNVEVNGTIVFIIDKAKETILDFLQGTVEFLLWPLKT